MARKFIPDNFNVDDVDAVKEVYTKLLNEDIPNDKDALRDWILRNDEIDSILSTVCDKRYVAMTCNTKDEKAAKEFEHLTNEVFPAITEISHDIEKKLIAHPALDQIRDEFGEYIKGIETSIRIFSKDNIPLNVELSNEVQAYQKITGGMKVEFDGKTQTLPQMFKQLENTDRDLRERVWKAMWEERYRHRQELDDSFDKLYALRNKKAKNSGFTNFIDYIYTVKERCYTPKECYDFHDSVEKFVLPLCRKLYERNLSRMGLEKFRPWDIHVDPLGREPLAPYKTGDELIEKVDQMFEAIDPRAGKWAREMQAKHLIDADSRLGKAPGGYQATFDEERSPFIFMNGTGTDSDIYTLLHESGHSFHQYNRAHQPIVSFRSAPSEFAEVASMSMELLGMDQLGKFYNEDDAKRSRETQLSDVILLFPWVAKIDLFQHEIYKTDTTTAEDRNRIWKGINARLDTGLIDYSGFEHIHANDWQRQLHLFECPFYYIEYGIAQLGAIQVWMNYKKDPTKAINDLFAAEALGASRPANELFAAANIKFDFSAETIEPLVQFVAKELGV